MADAGKRKQTAGSDAGGDDHSLLDAAPDCIDPRHGYYEPTSQHLPDVLVGCQRVLEILDEGWGALPGLRTRRHQGVG